MQQRADDLEAASSALLVAGDLDPVTVDNSGGRSPLLLVGDHAGHIAPARLGDLGVGAQDWRRHIACDIGVASLGRALAEQLDAAFIHQPYSRLVIDCNRALADPGSIATQSDGTHVPGNGGLSQAKRQARADAIFRPYHDRIARELDVRAAQGRSTVLVSLHSFTPAMAGIRRPWRFGVLHRHDSAFSRAVLTALADDWGEEVGDNQPYAMDEVDYTVPFHTQGRDLDYLELEVRQDLIANDADRQQVAGALAKVLRDVAEVFLGGAK